MTKSLVFRVRQIYFDAIVNEDKNIEYRKDSAYWQKRVFGMSASQYCGVMGIDESKTHFNLTITSKEIAERFGLLIGVFICGKRLHRREVIKIQRIKTPDWFSEQGKRDVDTPTCLAFHLGKKILPKNY